VPKNPTECHTVDVVGSPTIIIDSSDSDTSVTRDVTISGTGNDSVLCEVLPAETSFDCQTVSYPSSTVGSLPVSTSDHPVPPLSKSTVTNTGPSVTTDSSSLLASYRDILLAHLPTFTDKSSPKPGVAPLRYKDVTIRRLKRRARGTPPVIDPGPVGTDDEYIPLSVRLDLATNELATGALRGKPISPVTK